MSEIIWGTVETKLVGPGYDEDPGDPNTGKPYLVLTFGETVVRVTANLAEMIGGIGRGMNSRIGDFGL